MTTVSVHEAKTHLSRLINAVLAGEEVIVSRGKEPVIKLVALRPPPRKVRTPGALAHMPGAKGILDHGFWDPLPEDLLGFGDGDDLLA